MPERARPRAVAPVGVAKLDESALLLFWKRSGPVLTKFVSRRTVRDATTVDATTAGTLKMMDMIAFRFRIMNTVAIVFATNAMTK
jgi:hypothetical protein